MGEFEKYRGTCDASAAVGIGAATHFITASDEDYTLRVYDHAAPGMPAATFDLKPFLAPASPKEEPDVEGAARVGKRIYWITSHGRDNDGLEQESRRRFFATDVTVANGKPDIRPVGRPYKNLLADLARAPELAPFKLGDAAMRPPEAPDGLNIEGMAPAPDGTLLIGFRNPVPEGRALVVRLRNPAPLVDTSGVSADLALAARLDLGRRGIRALEFVPELGTYLLIAGSFDDTRNFGLFRWTGEPSQQPVPIASDLLTQLNPEELLVVPGAAGKFVVRLLSDDGDLPVGEKKCKKLKDPEKQSFRAGTFELRL